MAVFNSYLGFPNFKHQRLAAGYPNSTSNNAKQFPT